MTRVRHAGIKQDTINDASVAEYLQTYPDFFERNGALLAKLRLPHLRDVECDGEPGRAPSGSAARAQSVARAQA